MSDFQQTLTSLSLLHTSLYRMQLFQNAHAVKNVKTDVISIISRLEAAERERDELRAEQAEHDEQIARMEGKFSLAKRALDSKTARCEKAEAELRRRDAAAGEPAGVVTGYAVNGCVVSGNNLSIDDRVYTTATPAVVPPAISTEGLDPESKDIDEVRNLAHIVGANWMRQQCLELGAQQQKVVELPTPFNVDINLTRACGDIEYQYHEFGEQFDRDDVLAALDAAGVKWEVKK